MAMAPSNRRRIATALVPLLVLAPTVALLLAALLRWGMRCDETCRDRTGEGAEPGQPWPAYESSWQWDAQFALAVVGLLAAVAAVWFAQRTRWRATALAIGCTIAFGGGWVLWYQLSPGGP